jgi:glycosyltransferase involved in cell wall biosynthesis
MGASGQRLVTENYTWAKCAASYLEVYSSCAGKARRNPGAIS